MTLAVWAAGAQVIQEGAGGKARIQSGGVGGPPRFSPSCMAPRFQELPRELWFEVATNCASLKDVAALIASCRQGPSI